MQFKIIITLCLSISAILLPANEQDKNKLALKNKTNSECVLGVVTDNIDLQNIIADYSGLYLIEDKTKTLKAHDKFRKISFSKDGKYIVCILKNNEIIISNIDTMKSEYISDYKDTHAIEISNNRKIFAVGYSNSDFKIIDTQKHSCAQTYNLEHRVSGLTFSNDDTHIAVFIGKIKKLHVIDIEMGKIINSIDMPATIPDLRFSPDDRDLIAFGNFYNWGLYLINDIKTANSGRITQNYDAACAVYSPNGNNIAIGLNNHAIYICDKYGKFLKHVSNLTLPARIKSLIDLVFAHDNKYIISANDNELNVWDTNSDTANLQKIKINDFYLGKEFLAISPDNKYVIATTSGSNILKFWYNQKIMITEPQNTDQ